MSESVQVSVNWVPGPHTGAAGEGSWTSGRWQAGHADGSVVELPDGRLVVRATHPETPSGSTPYIISPPFPVPPTGEATFRARVWKYTQDYPKDARIEVRWYDANGDMITSAPHRDYTPEGIGETYHEVYKVADIPAGSETAKVIVFWNGAVADISTGDYLQFGDVALLTGERDTYFDGGFPDGALNSYTWTGPANNSASSWEVRQMSGGTDPRSPSAPVPARAQRRGWRYFATRFNGDGTETLLDPDVPLKDVNVEDVLSGHNALTGKIEPSYARLKDPEGQPLFREWSTGLYAEHDGEIRGGGILANSGLDGPSWALEATGLTSYAVDMPYTGSGYKGIKVDPIDMYRLIWAHLQAQPGGDLGLEIAATTTKGKVKIGTELKQVQFDTQSGPVSFEAGPYKLNWYTNHNLASDLDALALETPFDYHERHFWDASGNLRHRVDIGYPTIGRRREDLRFTYGVNVFDPVAMERDGAQYASGTLVLGAGEGAAMIKSLREPASRPDGRLRRIATVVDDTIKSTAAANRRGDRENQWRSRLGDVESVMVQNHPHARLGSAQVGDEIRIEGRGDWIDVDMWVRILGIAFSPDDGEVAEYTIARTDRMTG